MLIRADPAAEMRSQTNRKRGRDTSVKENGVLAAKVAVAEKRVKSCRSPSSGHRHYSPTGRKSPTAALNGHADSPLHKSNGLLVDRQPAVPPLPAVNGHGFPLTRDAPAATRPSRVADNGHSPAVQPRKAAKGPQPQHKATQLKSSSQATANQRSCQPANNNNNNKVQQPAKQRNSGPTGGEDMVIVSALRRQQMKDAFQPWVMQVVALFIELLPVVPRWAGAKPGTVPFIVSHRCQPNLLGHTHRPPSLGAAVGRPEPPDREQVAGRKRSGCARRAPSARHWLRPSMQLGAVSVCPAGCPESMTAPPVATTCPADCR